MGMEFCCGTTCDPQDILRELEALRAFKEATLKVLTQAEADAHPLSTVAGGLLSEALNEGSPITITRYRHVDAYLLPADLVLKLKEMDWDEE